MNINKKYLGYSSSILIGITLVQKGLSYLENGDYIVGAVYCIIGGAVIIYDVYKGFRAAEETAVSRVRKWL